MAYGSVAVDTINTSTGVFASNNAVTGIAKAWANFGYVASAVVINNSFNVSSITRTGTGAYTITFTTAMPNAYYSISSGIQGANGGYSSTLVVLNAGASPSAPATTGFSINTFGGSSTGTNFDPNQAYFAVFSS
jgi:hypothetical protein